MGKSVIKKIDKFKRIIIPQEIREDFNLEKGKEVELDINYEEGKITISHIKNAGEDGSD